MFEKNKLEKIHKLGEKGKADKLVPFTTAQDAEQRAAAFEAVGCCKGDDAKNTLIAGINDPDPSVRIAVAKGLQKIGTAHDEESIKLRMGKETDEKVKQAFHDAMTAVKGRR